MIFSYAGCLHLEIRSWQKHPDQNKGVNTTSVWVWVCVFVPPPSPPHPSHFIYSYRHHITSIMLPITLSLSSPFKPSASFSISICTHCNRVRYHPLPMGQLCLPANLFSCMFLYRPWVWVMGQQWNCEYSPPSPSSRLSIGAPRPRRLAERGPPHVGSLERCSVNSLFMLCAGVNNSGQPSWDVFYFESCCGTPPQCNLQW